MNRTLELLSDEDCFYLLDTTIQELKISCPELTIVFNDEINYFAHYVFKTKTIKIPRYYLTLVKNSGQMDRLKTTILHELTHHLLREYSINNGLSNKFSDHTTIFSCFYNALKLKSNIDIYDNTYTDYDISQEIKLLAHESIMFVTYARNLIDINQDYYKIIEDILKLYNETYEFFLRRRNLFVSLEQKEKQLAYLLDEMQKFRQLTIQEKGELNYEQSKIF